jgi:hypothetical protein
MPQTRSFRETVTRRAASDPAFRAALVEEAARNILDGDVETASGQLCDVVNATMGLHASDQAPRPRHRRTSPRSY